MLKKVDVGVHSASVCVTICYCRSHVIALTGLTQMKSTMEWTWSCTTSESWASLWTNDSFCIYSFVITVVMKMMMMMTMTGSSHKYAVCQGNSYSVQRS